MAMKPKILIVGGGYGGLRTAITLQEQLKVDADVTLISKHDYHYQTTLLHKVAIGTLSARKSRVYFRKILDLQKVHFIKDKILSFEPESKRVIGNGGAYEYDYLVIALGFKPDDFGIKGVEEYAHKLQRRDLIKVVVNKVAVCLLVAMAIVAALILKNGNI